MNSLNHCLIFCKKTTFCWTKKEGTWWILWWIENNNKVSILAKQNEEIIRCNQHGWIKNWMRIKLEFCWRNHFVAYIYKWEYRCLSVCPSVCLLVCGGIMEIQTTAPILMKFCTQTPTCPRKVLVQVWPRPLAWGSKILKA